MDIAARIAGILLLDAAVAGAGAWALWNSGGVTVVSGSAIIQTVLALGLVVALTFRHVLIGRRSVLDRDHRATTIERAVTTGHIVLMVAAISIWMVTQQYYWGWQLAFAAVFIIVAVALQLLVDVTSGRNRAAVDPAEQRARSRSFALETWRLASLAMASLALALTAPVHSWTPAVLNFLILFDAVVIGAALGIRLVLAGRRDRSTDLHEASGSRTPSE